MEDFSHVEVATIHGVITVVVQYKNNEAFTCIRKQIMLPEYDRKENLKLDTFDETAMQLLLSYGTFRTHIKCKKETLQRIHKLYRATVLRYLQQLELSVAISANLCTIAFKNIPVYIREYLDNARRSHYDAQVIDNRTIKKALPYLLPNVYTADLNEACDYDELVEEGNYKELIRCFPNDLEKILNDIIMRSELTDEMLKYFIQKGTNIDKFMALDTNVLYNACEENRYKAVEILLANGADPNLLVNSEDGDTLSALEIAIIGKEGYDQQDEEEVNKLIKLLVNAGAFTELSKDTISDCKEAKLIIPLEQRDTFEWLSRWAAKRITKLTKDDLEYMLDREFQIDKLSTAYAKGSYTNILHAACAAKAKNTIALLLEHDANPNIKCSEFRPIDILCSTIQQTDIKEANEIITMLHNAGACKEIHPVIATLLAQKNMLYSNNEIRIQSA